MTWSRARRILAVSLLLASVTYVAWRLLSDDEAIDALLSISPVAAVGLVMLQVAYLIPQAVRYRLAIEHTAGTSIPWGEWLRLFLIGRFLNTLIPQAGNAYRGLRLKEDHGIPVTRYLGGFLAFTWLSTIMNLLLAVIVISILEPSLMIGQFPALVVTSGGLVVVTSSPPLALLLIRQFRLERGIWGWAYRRFEDLLGAAVSIVHSRSTLAAFSAVGLVGFGLAIAIFGASFNALDLDASASAVVLFFVLLQLATYVNLTPGNLGVLEIGFGALGSQLGIGLVGGLLVAAVIRVSGTIALLLIGIAAGGLPIARTAAAERAQGRDHVEG